MSAFFSALRLAPPDLTRNNTIRISIHFCHFKLSSLVSMTTVSTPALMVGYLDTCALKRKVLTYEFDYHVSVETSRRFQLSLTVSFDPAVVVSDRTGA